jgi:transglutaminase-like putative cysteine protease
MKAAPLDPPSGTAQPISERPLERIEEILGPAGSLERLLMRQVRFLPERDLEWSRVRRVRYFAYQRFEYLYPSLVRELSQRLMVQPRQRHGDQHLLDFRLSTEPIPLEVSEHHDVFNNPVIELRVARINHWTTFEVMFCTERTRSDNAGSIHTTVTRAEARQMLYPTPLTEPDGYIREVAESLRAQSGTPLELAQRISDWVSDRLHYQHDVTHVGTTATEALEVGAGLCQDYTHVALSLCRAAGLPARYVSGHMLGEGGSHAWMEVIVPQPNGMLQAVGFDPTNHRRPNLGYNVVAVGRDYDDVPPTSGRFVGDHSGVLHFEKRAGLIELELDDGDVLRPDQP